jgi:uroporphyrinogen III methyltransferase/synthase
MTKIYLVGGGPGDPELVTVKGRRVLALADVVLYDHLAPEQLLDLAPPTAERIYVGKKRADHAYTQQEICDLMIARARRGQTVVRLKGGDPFIFGRGGEELQAVAEAGIPFEVVPGITAPLGIAAYSGIPLTHRDSTSVLTFVPGHHVNAVDWSLVARSDTLVVFMGVEHIDDIVGELLRAGRPPLTPAVAVRWATRPDQQTVAGTLEDLPRLVHDHGLTPPATVLIGDVVRFREKFSWFERLPLFGSRIVVTRARAQAGELTDELRRLGAHVLELPAIELRPLEDYSALDAAIEKLREYDWIIFTSTNAVEYFLAQLRARGRDVRDIRGRVCAIGTATRAALEAIHLRPDLVPAEAFSEGVAAAFADIQLTGARVLLPRAAEAREVIPETLRARRAVVDIADAYRNVIPDDAAARAQKIFGAARKPDWITFTSGSAVKNVLAVAPAGSLDGVRVASIGPATSDVVRKHGLTVDAEAREASVRALVEAILEATPPAAPA